MAFLKKPKSSIGVPSIGRPSGMLGKQGFKPPTAGKPPSARPKLKTSNLKLKMKPSIRGLGGL